MDSLVCFRSRAEYSSTAFEKNCNYPPVLPESFAYKNKMFRSRYFQEKIHDFVSKKGHHILIFYRSRISVQQMGKRGENKTLSGQKTFKGKRDKEEKEAISQLYVW